MLDNLYKDNELNSILNKAIATGLGTGYAPIIPGTFGTLLGVGIYMIIGHLSLGLILLVILVITLLGIYTSGRLESDFGKKDPSFVVIDEVSGYLITMIFLPFHVKYVLIGFILFRIIDIIKPYPARQLESLKGGLGIMIDDVIAGLYAGIIAKISIYILNI